MHMYCLLEAVNLLTSKLGSAKKSMDETVENLEFWREQATVMKWDVKRYVHSSNLASNLKGEQCVSTLQRLKSRDVEQLRLGDGGSET
ncbi:hypothetical protein JCM24511_08121 [Saitozyma sp. JCM 24511]|nr:hypothetical protein JCM24511_08121 [Saitozyma sp. JCM 24511]